MIKSFKCKETEQLKASGRSRRFKAFERIALRKLDMLDAVVILETLRIPPSNHFEALHGDREGQYSIRINLQANYDLCVAAAQSEKEIAAIPQLALA